ncbi:MAG: type II secretion system F family protein [Bifidobacteriaceae bacterium]|nr:type II secretion system F family protein [Bifidobacteriaceae bacterium]
MVLLSAGITVAMAMVWSVAVPPSVMNLPRGRKRLRGASGHGGGREESDAQTVLSSSDFVLLVRLFIVAFRQGASIPLCLVHVSEVFDRDDELGLRGVAAALNRGVPWAAAWSMIPQRHLGCLRSLMDALESSWTQGASPIAGLESLARSRLEQEETNVEVVATQLGVRLLLPTGLCFLPAFILIGVIPSVASFAGIG